MNNDNNLYFIPLLVKAFKNNNPISALEESLAEIMCLGKLEEYKRGIAQFKEFLNVGIEKQSDDSEHMMNRVLLGIATRTIEFAEEEYSKLIRKIENNPKLNEK